MADRTDALNESLVALWSYLLGQGTLRDCLHRVAELGQRAVAAADMAGITLLDGDRPTTAACTHPTVVDVDCAQYETGHGPCLEAYRTRQAVTASFGRDEQRWPEVARRAAEKGVLSVLSLPLVVDGRGIGALNFYSRRGQPFDGVDQGTGLAFATQAAVLLANAQNWWDDQELNRQLDEALRSRATIEQAKGVLMAQSAIGPEEALELLKRASRRENRRLRDVAADVVERASGADGRPGESVAESTAGPRRFGERFGETSA